MSRGMSLLETVIGAALIIILLFVVVSLFPSCLLAIKKSENLTIASTLAQQALEQARTEPFDQTNQTPSDVQSDGTDFHVTRAVDRPSTTLKNVVVIVTFAQGTPAGGSVRAETCMVNSTNP